MTASVCAAPTNVLELLGVQPSAPSTPTAFRPRALSESLRAPSPSALVQLRARLGLRASPAPSAASSHLQANADSARASLVGPPTPTMAPTCSAAGDTLTKSSLAGAHWEHAMAMRAAEAGASASASPSASASASAATGEAASAAPETERERETAPMGPSSEHVICLLRQWLADSNPLHLNAGGGGRTLHPIAEAVCPSPLPVRPLSSSSWGSECAPAAAAPASPCGPPGPVQAALVHSLHVFSDIPTPPASAAGTSGGCMRLDGSSPLPLSEDARLQLQSPAAFVLTPAIADSCTTQVGAFLIADEE